MKTTVYRIGNEITTIHSLPEFSFEAMETYKKTLDMAQAIREGQRLSEIQKRKAAYEEEQKNKAAEEAARAEEKRKSEAQVQQSVQPPVHSQSLPLPEPIEQSEPLVQMDFRVWCSKEQLLSLRQFLVKNEIKFGKVE